MAAQLKKYDYEFDWRHAAVASVLSITVYTPQSHEFVERVVDCVTVYYMGRDVPQVRMTTMPLQHMRAILVEIERENGTRPTAARKEPETVIEGKEAT